MKTKTTHLSAEECLILRSLADKNPDVRREALDEAWDYFFDTWYDWQITHQKPFPGYDVAFAKPLKKMLRDPSQSLRYHTLSTIYQYLRFAPQEQKVDFAHKVQPLLHDPYAEIRHETLMIIDYTKEKMDPKLTKVMLQKFNDSSFQVRDIASRMISRHLRSASSEEQGKLQKLLVSNLIDMNKRVHYYSQDCLEDYAQSFPQKQQALLQQIDNQAVRVQDELKHDQQQKALFQLAESTRIIVDGVTERNHWRDKSDQNITIINEFHGNALHVSEAIGRRDHTHHMVIINPAAGEAVASVQNKTEKNDRKRKAGLTRQLFAEQGLQKWTEDKFGNAGPRTYHRRYFQGYQAFITRSL
jgi:hypothetical protein